jgi:hypothetical protein
MSRTRATFTHGPKGPGHRAANFQGRHIKKIEIEVWYGEKKAVHEREIQGRSILKTLCFVFCHFLCCFCVHITEYEQMGWGGGAKFSWAQGRKIPKYGPE